MQNNTKNAPLEITYPHIVFTRSLTHQDNFTAQSSRVRNFIEHCVQDNTVSCII